MSQALLLSHLTDEKTNSSMHALSHLLPQYQALWSGKGCKYLRDKGMDCLKFRQRSYVPSTGLEY